MSYRVQIVHGSSYGQSKQNTKVQKVQKSTKVLITQPFFEIQTPDFAWIFILTVQSYGKEQKYKNTKVLITQPFFELQTPDFAWKFIWTVQPNDKVQKYKNTKVQNRKVQKLKKCKKMQKT